MMQPAVMAFMVIGTWAGFSLAAGLAIDAIERRARRWRRRVGHR